MSESADLPNGDGDQRARPKQGRQPRGPLPDHEFPVWLMRTSIERIGDAARSLLVGPQYKRLARFSSDMRTCTRSSLDIARALELCVKPHRNTRLGECWASAASQLQHGSTLAEALRPGEKLLPAFYLPVIEAGEESGRLDEAFAFLERHCNLLAGPAAAIRNLWLLPVCIMLAGAVINFVLTLAMGSPWKASTALAAELGSWLKLVIMVAVVALTPLRQLFDQLRLSLPWIGELEREIAVHRFFRVMALVYGVGGERVDAMIHTAARTVTNHAAREDLLKAATAIKNQATISEAFRRVTLLNEDERATIDVGELSGSLERCFDQIADETESSMMAKLAFLQPLLTRLVMGAVVFSIIGTMMELILR